MTASLIAAVLTFTATATGVEKGTPLEFLFAGRDTDRDYETMFLLDEPVEAFLSRLENAGFPRGVPTDQTTCRLWPVGAKVVLEPALERYVDRELPEGLSVAPFIYTGGTRLSGGFPEAATNMPASVFALYSLAQSPFVYDGVYEQGLVYGSQKALVTLKKGEKVTFRLSCDSTTMPVSTAVHFNATNIVSELRRLRNLSAKSEVSVKVTFSDDLPVVTAVVVAEALASVDSVRLKINGRDDGELFYRAFLPLVKWRSRQERLTQPFEVTLGATNRVVFIDEDWSVEGNDPKLTEREISFQQMIDHPRTDTAFFFVGKNTRVGAVKSAVKQLPKTVVNHYVYVD